MTSLTAESAIPVIVDAAFLNYPPETMRRYADAGAGMVCYSAKYFYGPNAAGFVAENLLEAVSRERAIATLEGRRE